MLLSHRSKPGPKRPLTVAALTLAILAAPAWGQVSQTAPLVPEEARDLALTVVTSDPQVYGLSPADVADVVVADQHAATHSGTTHVYLQQRIDGIAVHNAILNLALTSEGRVAHVGNRFVPRIEAGVDRSTVAIGVFEAVERAADQLEIGTPQGLSFLEPASGPDRKALLTDGGISAAPIPARLVYQPLRNGTLRLAWDLSFDRPNDSHWWSVRVDAETGQIIDRDDWVDREQYEVYPHPIPSPHHTTPAPPADARQVVVDPFSTASPFGWHDTDGVPGPEFTITRGNNTHAYADKNGDNQPDVAPNDEPDGGPSLDFTGATVPMDLSLDPNNYVQGSLANLFYWTNITHDILYEYGFDEASGNFQVNNYGNGGLGNDDVRAEGQDGGGNCNAIFGTPSDGNRPRMQMFLCSNANPRRDGDMDHEVLIHEYGHGVSNRLTGGPAQAGCLNNAEQMGEGWSDYLGLMLTQRTGDAGTDARGVGTYLFGQGPTGPGIRNAPYSTDFGVNSFTYDQVGSVSIPHGVGFVWATMLWDMTWNLIDTHGFNPDLYDDWTTGGNNLALQLVMDGMKLQPCSPGFVDGRDAILAADDLLTGDGSDFSGVNQCAIWDAFTTRGLGPDADQGSNFSVTDGSSSFDRLDLCDTIGALPSQQAICQGGDAMFRIGVGAAFGAAVDLSLAGAPAGTTTGFSVDPVPLPVPTISDLTISNTAAVPPGNYPMTVTGNDGGTMHTANLSLDVFDLPPTSSPTPVAPTDGAEDEPIQPTLEWSPVADALSYTLEIDDDPAFGSIDYTVSGIEGTSHTVASDLEYLTVYYWRVRGDNPCGDSTNSVVFEFETLLFPGLCGENLQAVQHFFDDLEGTTTAWSSSGTGDTWNLSGARVTSGVSAFFAVDPVSVSDQRLVSPSYNLPAGVDQLTLQFQNYQAFETPNGDGRCWDAGVLEVSTDNGASWSQVPQSALLTDPYDNVIWNDQPGNNPITNDYGATLAWCDELQPFVQSVVDLSAWEGQTVRFAWRLGSDGASGNEGWYLDDVLIQSCLSTQLFTDGFESGDTSLWSSTTD